MNFNSVYECHKDVTNVLFIISPNKDKLNLFRNNLNSALDIL